MNVGDDVNSMTRLITNDKDNTLPQDGRRCPLCESEIQLFFINFNEKTLMCGNPQCDFPFGYEEMTFVKEDNDFQADEEVDSIKYSKGSATPTTNSMLTESACYDIEQINAVLDAETASIDAALDSEALAEKLYKKKLAEERIRAQLADISSLATQLTPDDKTPIRKREWLRNLKSMRGAKLLKPEEISLLNKKEPYIGSGELKINVTQGDDDTMSSIKIEIHANKSEMADGKQPASNM